MRVLRALSTKAPQVNLGVRDVARLAGVSHSRTAQVLRALAESGVVVEHKSRWGPLYELNDDHYWTPQLWTLFDEELHIFQAIEGFARAEARKTRRPVGFRAERGIGHDLELVASGLSACDPGHQRWFQELEAGIERQFGLDVRVAPEDPNEWLMTLD